MKPAIINPTPKSPPIAAIIPPITMLAIMYTTIAVIQPLFSFDDELLLEELPYAVDLFDCVVLLVDVVDVVGFEARRDDAEVVDRVELDDVDGLLTYVEIPN